MSNKNKDYDKFNNPFSLLKGLSVSGQQKVEKKSAPEPIQPLKAEPEKEADFFAEMAGLGVKKIERDALEKPEPNRPVDEETAGEVLKAGKSPKGNAPARARRDKQLRRGDIQPQAELDLHGVKAVEVQQKVAWFVENAVFHGFEAVRIITGKGSHSDTGSVLRPLVEEYLNGSGRTFVVEWLQAPQGQGGKGAIIAFLKG